MASSWETGVRPGQFLTIGGGKCSGAIMPPRARIMACSMALRSSRTLPNQWRRCNSARASAEIAGRGCPFLRRQAVQKMARQLGDVVATLAQRRNLDLKRDQPKVEIVAEPSLRHPLPQGPDAWPRSGGSRSAPADRRRPAGSRHAPARAAASLAAASGMSATSSRKIVPPWACSSRPLRG